MTPPDLRAPFRSLGPLARLGTKLSGSVSNLQNITPGLGYPIAIDFGVSSLKVLQVAAGEPPSLVAAACLETPEGLLNDHASRLDFQLEALPRLIRKGGFKGKRAVCAIPAWQTLCKQFQFPRSDGLTTAQLVEAAIPSQFGCDPSSLVYRVIESGSERQGGRSEAIVVAVGRDVVERLMRAIVAAKLQPVGMQSEFTATLKAFSHMHRRETDLSQNTLYLDIGAHTTKVMIAHGSRLVFARVIEVGGKALDELIARQLGCNLAEARRQRLELDRTMASAQAAAQSAASLAADPDRRGPVAAPGFVDLAGAATTVAPGATNLGEPLEILTDEVQMCLRHHASQHPGTKIDRAIFVGGEARHRGLCAHIARALRLPAQTADPMARVARAGSEPTVGVDMRGPQPGWAVALGLCIAPTDL